MTGKEKCKALKEIRQQIADNNDIPFAVSQCTHQGECKGTCPKCEAELRYLEKELERKKKFGKAVAVAGISAGLCSTLTACTPADAVNALLFFANEYRNQKPIKNQPIELDGDVVIDDPYDYEGGLEYDPNFDVNRNWDDEPLAGEIEYDPSWDN